MQVGDFVEVTIYYTNSSRRVYGWITGFGVFPDGLLEGQHAVVVKKENGKTIYATPDEIKVMQTT
jgi:hypothetical protein